MLGHHRIVTDNGAMSGSEKQRGTTPCKLIVMLTFMLKKQAAQIAAHFDNFETVTFDFIICAALSMILY